MTALTFTIAPLDTIERETSNGYVCLRVAREYVVIVEIWHDDDPHYFATLPGPDVSFTDRRKAKRALNRYRKFRNHYRRVTGKDAPLHWV